MTKAEQEERQKRDAELNRKSEEQMKQCQKCHYYSKNYNAKLEYCDFVSWEGKLRDRGEGAGKCGSFQPKRKLTKKEAIERNRRSLIRSEQETTFKRFGGSD